MKTRSGKGQIETGRLQAKRDTAEHHDGTAAAVDCIKRESNVYETDELCVEEELEIEPTVVQPRHPIVVPKKNFFDRNMESNDKDNKKKTSKKKIKKDSAAYIKQKEKAKARKRKFLDNMTTEQKEIRRAKDREYYHKKKAEKKIKTITDMTEREKRTQRKLWIKNSKTYRQKKKLLGNTLQNTPPDSENENIPSLPSVSRKKAGRQTVRKDRDKAYRIIEKQNIHIKRLQNKIDRLRKKLERSNKSPKRTSSATNTDTDPTPKTKTNELLKNCDVPPEVRKQITVWLRA